MQRSRLFYIGVIVLAVGAITSFIGGLGEVTYIRCVSLPSSQCAVTDVQYTTDFLANSEILGVGMDFLLLGVIILIAGIITNYMTRLTNELKPSTATTRLCPKCGVQVARTAKFCDNCGNKLGE